MKQEKKSIIVRQSEVLNLINSLSDGEKIKIGNYIVSREKDTFSLNNLIDDEAYVNLIKDTLGEVELID